MTTGAFFDPSTQGLLALSAGLLQAGGPQPYPNNFGAALGSGMMQGMNAANLAQRSQLQNAMLTEQLKRAKFQGDMLDQLGKYYAGQIPGMAQGTPQAALAQGAAQGSVGPTNQNAALLAQMQPQQPQQPSQPTSYFNPGSLFNEGRMGMLAGLPGSEGLLSAALAHDPTLAGQVAGAQAGAKFPYEAVTSALRQVARPTILGVGQTAQSNFPLLPDFLQKAITNGLAGRSLGTPTGGLPPSVNQLSGPSPLAVESGKAHAHELEKQYGVWQNEANSAQQDNLLIDRMKAESQGFSPGKLAERYGELQAYLQRLPGMDTPERKAMLGDFQAFQKNATQLSTSAARTMGAREPGSVIAMFKNAYPNAELTSNALNAMFTQIQGLNDYKSLRQAAADQWRGTHEGTLDGFQGAWNKTSDPMFFVVQRMPPEVRQQFFAKMSATERQTFGMKYQAAIKAGFLPPAQ